MLGGFSRISEALGDTMNSTWTDLRNFTLRNIVVGQISADW